MTTNTVRQNGEHDTGSEQTEEDPDSGELTCLPWAGLLYRKEEDSCC